MVLPEVRLFEVLFVNFMSDFLTDTKSRFWQPINQLYSEICSLQHPY
jgi:hypothetical protein